ncbi:hypothetical protein D3C73_1501190 [compost metagenome]
MVNDSIGTVTLDNVHLSASLVDAVFVHQGARLFARSGDNLGNQRFKFREVFRSQA